MSQTPDLPEPVAGWRLLLAAALALLTALTVEFLVIALVAVVARLTGWRTGVSMSLVLGAGSLVAWAVAGVVAVETAEDRRGALAAAAVPPLLGLIALALGVVVRRVALDAGLLVAAASSLVLALVAFAGGWSWAARIRHRDALQ